MNSFPTLLVALLGLTTASAQTSFRLVSQMETTPLSNGRHHLQGWLPYNVSYFPGTEYYTNFPSSRPPGSTATLSVPLESTFPPGTYDLWVAFATQGTNLMIQGEAGNGTTPNSEYGGTPTWTRIGPLSTTTSFDQVKLTATKLQPQGALQNIWFAGVGITAPGFDKITAGINRWVQYLDMPVAPAESRSPGNLIPNSSFEFGLDAYGWSSGRNGHPANEAWLSNMTAEDAVDGRRSVVIGDGLGASRYSVRTPVLFLRGDKTQRLYNLSFHHRRRSGTVSTLRVVWGPVYTNSNPTSASQSGFIDVPVSGSWQRFSTNLLLRPSPNRLFQIEWNHLSPSGTVALDAVQLEEGDTATPYRPADTIECNLTLGRNGNLLDPTEPRNLIVETYNATSTFSNVVFQYEVFDWLNRKVTQGTNVFRAEPGYSSRPLLLTTTNLGLSRAFGWLDASPFTRSELVFSTVPLTNSVKLDPSSSFGGHAPAQTSVATSNALWGLTWQRGLSPAGIVEWDVLEPIQGVFFWGHLDARVASQQGSAVILGTLSSRDDFPAWANPNGKLRIDAWSNFVFRVVSRYKNVIRHWEDINEPKWPAAEFAPILTATAGAVKAADPTAFFVGFGGIDESQMPTWAPQVWSLLSPTTIAQIDALSVHAYPADGDDIAIDLLADLRRLTGKPVWNTETGVWGWGDFKGDRTGGPIDTHPYTPHWAEYQFTRTVWINPAAQARNWIRSFGRGMSKYFLYDGRLSSYHLGTEDTNPTWFNYDDSLNSVGTAYLWSKQFLDHASSVTCPTNAVGDPLAFVFDRPAGPTLAVFTRSKTNYSASIPTTALAVHDLMGNLITTNPNDIPLGRVPTFWVSPTLTAPQLHALFANATITPRADTAPPSVSIDVTAHGPCSPRQLPLRFRWTAIDDTSVNTDETPTALVTRYRLNGLTDWSPWSAERAAELTQMPPTLAFLEVQARDSAGNLSLIASGPTFGQVVAEAKHSAPKAPQGITIQLVPQ